MRLLETPRVFVSYRWESDAYSNWVTRFVCDLGSLRVQVVFDRLIQTGRQDDATGEVVGKIATCHAFLAILTPSYLEALGWRDGAWHDYIPNNRWVFDEFQLALQHEEAETTEIIPILRAGDIAALPYDWNSGNTLDLRTDEAYAAKVNFLADYLHFKRKIPRLSATRGAMDAAR
jgi:hypothetical protein